MALTREKKEHIVTTLTNAAKDSESMVFVNFHGLGVADTNSMRRTLRDKGITYTVARKTLIHRALDKSAEGEIPVLNGEVAVVYGADPIAPANAIAEFAQTHKENLSILGGIFQGVFKNKNEMEVIASIPGIDTLRGMFVNVINSPIQGLVIALNGIAESKS
jgi:large subunit ribosomal protein L10